jgi:cell division protein FtsZ
MNTLAMELTPATDTPPAVPAPATLLRVFGVGNAGVNLLEHLLPDGMDEVSFVAINADAASLAASAAPSKLHLETRRLRGLGTAGDPERGRAAATEHLASLSDACRGAELVLILTGLGGGAGTGISPVLARAARDAGALVLACAVMPFDCEGSRRQRQAQAGLEYLRATVDGVICLPNQKVFQLIDERTSLMDTFKTANARLAEGLRGLLRLFTRPGLIPIHLTELCALLRGRPVESVLATAEAHGPNRGRDVVEKIIGHPLLDGGQALTTAEAVVVSITGGPDLSMADVNRVMEQINRQCETAQVLMGATVDTAFQDRLHVTLIATRREPETASSGEEPAGAVASRTEARPSAESESELLQMSAPARGRTRLVPPPPALPPEQFEQTLGRQNGLAGRPRRVTTRLRQGTLPLDVISRGRFDKTEPNIHRGEDLDTPTYLRRGCVLN